MMSLFPNFDRFKKNASEFIEQAKQDEKNKGRQPTPGTPSKAVSMWQAIVKNMGQWGALFDALVRGAGGKIDPAMARELERAIEDAERLAKSRDPGSREPTNKPASRELVSEPDETRGRTPEVGGGRGDPHRDAEVGENGQLVEWVMVNRSSNVHSFAYEYAPEGRSAGNVLVRFLGGDSKQRSGPGPLYRYKDVPRAVFVALKMASSAGGAVWDELRVRGTVAGHQFAYDLIGAGPDGYIPRQAVVGKRGRGGLAFVKRSLNGQKSQLPEHQVRGGRNLTKDFRGEASKLRFKRK